MDSFPLENTNSAKKVRRTKKQLNSNSSNITTTELNNNNSSSNINNGNNTNNNTASSQVATSATENSQTILQTEMVNYINKLEFLTLKTRLQLLRERKAYSQLFSSLALFFDSKDIAAQKVQDYVESIVLKLHDDRESEQTDPADLDWVKFLKEASQQQQMKATDPNNQTPNIGAIQPSQSQVPATISSNSAGQMNSNGSNIIRLQINKQPDQSFDKTNSQVGKVNLNKRQNKIDSSIDDQSQEEPKLKRKKRIDSTTINNSETALSSQQAQQYQPSQPNYQYQLNSQQQQQQQLSQQQIQQQNYLSQQEMFIQNLLKAQQRNQIVPNEQMMQQMIINLQQQQQ